MTMHKLCIISRSVAPIDAIDPIAVVRGWRGVVLKLSRCDYLWYALLTIA